MSKLITLSLVALLVASPVLNVVLATTQAQAARCTSDKPCVPPPDKPGDVPPPPGHDGPGNPGDPYIPPDFFVADIVKNMLISCRVSGTPEAEPNDLKFRNIGDLTIPAGTQVYWMIKESGEHGYFMLPEDLPVGKSVSDLDVLVAGLPTSSHCYSKIM